MDGRIASSSSYAAWRTTDGFDQVFWHSSEIAIRRRLYQKVLITHHFPYLLPHVYGYGYGHLACVFVCGHLEILSLLLRLLFFFHVCFFLFLNVHFSSHSAYPYV